MQLRLRLSHLREHKVKQNFQDSVNFLCNCGHDIESKTHFRLHYSLLMKEALSLAL